MDITPFENDTKLAALHQEFRKHAGYLASAEKSLKAKNRDGSYRYVEGSYNHTSLTEQRDKARATMERLAEEMRPFEREYIERRWARYFLVTNGNGHVHKSMTCATCYPTTEFAWLPELADKSQDEMVEEFGEKACTVCFPTAPVNPRFNGPGRRDKASMDAKATEKASKAAAKLAKAILPDGSELRLSDPYDRPKTLIAAQRMLSSKLKDVEMDKLAVAEGLPGSRRNDERVADIQTLADAISAKTGEPVDDLLSAAQAKAAKTAAKEWAASKVYAKQMGW